MLKGIDPLVLPELLWVLARMGHGDELVIVDRNYPAYSTNGCVVRVDGADSITVGRAVFSLLPIDAFTDTPIARMQVVGDESSFPQVQSDFLAIASEAAGREVGSRALSRAEFYDRAREAFAVLVTGEDRPYGCFLVTKGVLPEFTPNRPSGSD